MFRWPEAETVQGITLSWNLLFKSILSFKSFNEIFIVDYKVLNHFCMLKMRTFN